MIDLEKGQEQLDKADGFLEKLEVILRKHWGKLLLGALGYGIYWFFGLVAADIEKNGLDDPKITPIEEISTTIPESTSEHKEKYVITKKTFIVDDYGRRKGDTVYIDYYDDGFIDKYYATDGKIYYADE